jgi:hypothetical protein
MRKPLTISAVTLTLLFSAALTHITLPVHGASHVGVEVAWGGDVPTQGGVATIIVNVRNLWSQPLTLRFVGVRLDWMGEDTYLYGGGSELDRLMNPGDIASYSMRFTVPDDASPGFHPAYILVVYTVSEEDMLVEYHQVVEVRPGLNVVAAVTLTVTEVVTVPGEASNVNRVKDWRALSTLLAGLALALFAVWKWRLKK